MKHKIHLLLLLSAVGSIECAQTYGAAVTGSGAGKQRKQSTDGHGVVSAAPGAVTMPHYREIPPASHVQFGTQRLEPLPRQKRREFYKWSAIDTDASKTDPTVLAIITSHEAHIKSKCGLRDDDEVLTIARRLFLQKNNASESGYVPATYIADAYWRKTGLMAAICKTKHIVQQTQSMPEIESTPVDVASQLYVAVTPGSGKKVWAFHPITPLLKALKESEGKTSRAPTNERQTDTEFMGAHPELTIVNHMLSILNQSGSTEEKRKAINRIPIDPLRNRLNHTLPEQLRLSDSSIAAAYQTQIATRLTALENARPTAIPNAQAYYLLTCVNANPSRPVPASIKKLFDARVTGLVYPSATVALDRTREHSSAEALLQSIRRIQELRDLQIAFGRDGKITEEELKTALFAPEVQRCKQMIEVIRTHLVSGKVQNNSIHYDRMMSTYLKRLTIAENFGVEPQAAAPAQEATTEAPAESAQ